MPKVSIIIPAYNAMAYLPEALESVFRQTFSDFDVIIVNDGSSDETDWWVSQLRDSRVRLITQTNQGKSAARNAGIAQAQGEYLAFLDADDLWEATKLEKQVRCLEEQPEVGLAYTWTALADQKGNPTGRIIASNAQGDVWSQIVQANILACGSTPLILRECFETVGLFSLDLPFAQDWDMWIRIAARYPFVVVKESLVRYRQHAKNTSVKWKPMHKCSIIVLERAFQRVAPERLDLKKQAYYSLYLYLGWIALRNRDYRQATDFWQQASINCPQWRSSSELIRLGLAIALIRCFGADAYSKVLSLNHTLRQQFSATIY